MAGNVAGDDYYDPESGYRVIWGDSCVSNCETGAKLRVLAASAWLAIPSSSVFVSRTTLTGDAWSMTAMASAYTSAIGIHCRPGVHPTDSVTLEEYYLYYVDTTGGLRRQKLKFDGGYNLEWEAASSAGAIQPYDGIAVHPVSEDEVIVVGYTAPYVWLKYCEYTTYWVVGDTWYVHLAEWDKLRWSDAHWSDAVINPANSSEIVIALNLSRWGSAQVVIYDKAVGVYSQPKEMFPSQEQWGNMKCVCSGLSVVNDRIWAVTVREPWASGDTVMAHHVALMSSPDGRHWRDEDFVTISTLRGKLLYVPGESYCYVVGNSSVAKAQATNKLGTDLDSMKYLIDEVYEVSHSIAGPSSAPEITARAKNVGIELSASGLVEAGNELDLDLGTQDNPFGDIATGMLITANRERTNVEDEIVLQATGMMGRLTGIGSYRPAAAKVFDGPYFVHSRFVFDETGAGRLTVRQETGRWVAKRYHALGRYVLHCQKAGIALLPHALQHQSFIMRTTFMPKVSLEGIYFVFWYENKDNYWQAGIYNNAGTYQLETRRMEDGELSSERSATVLGSLTTDTWYSMYLYVRPGEAKLYFNDSGSYDYGSPTATVIDYPFLLVGDVMTSYGDIEEYHIGLKVDPFEDWEGAVKSGTVAEAAYNYLEDASPIFNASDIGRYALCNDQSRRINAVGELGYRLYIQPAWSTTPEEGDEYGVYPEDARDGPGAYFGELFACEAIVPYTVDDVVNSIFELAGVSISGAFSGTGVGATGNGTLMGDVDVKFESATDPCSLSIWGSTDDYSGDAASSCLVVTANAASDLVEIVAVESNPDLYGYQTHTLQASHPAMVGFPSTKTIRVQANHKLIIVSCNGHFLTAFPAWSYWNGGWVGTVTAGTATTTEFCTVLDSFIWDTNEPAGSALARLMRGRRAKMVERPDGSVAISRFDTPLGSAGVFDAPVTRLLTGQNDTELISLVEMVGADDRAFYIDFDAARKRLRYMRVDNPTLETQYDALVEGGKLTNLGMQRFGAGMVALYVPDPALELEAEVTIDGQRYVVESISFSINTTGAGPQVRARITARQFQEDIVVARYDSGDYYDYGGEYS